MGENQTVSRSGLPVAIDAMGGDLGPAVVVEGVLRAERELGISAILVGNENELRALLARSGASTSTRITVEAASEVVTMEDSPSRVVRGKANSSLRRAFDLVREGKASSVVSPGNTGAVMAAGLFAVGTLPGIARPAIATLIPKVGDNTPTVLLDSGANIDCHATQLVQFALMGSNYARVALGIAAPRVGLLSNGSELSKGTDTIRAAAMILQSYKEINFIGFIEGRDLPRNVVDVVVCDGFIGNIVLKTMEGSVELVLDSIRHYVERSVRGKVGIWLAKPMFKSLFREKLDPSSYGGAPLLGLGAVAIVCHGASNSKAIFNAVRVAEKFVQEKLIEKLEESLGSLDLKDSSGVEDGIWDRMGQRFEKRKWRKGSSAAVLGGPSDVDRGGE